MKRKRKGSGAFGSSAKPERLEDRPKRAIPPRQSPKDIAREFCDRCWPGGCPEEQRREVIKIFVSGMFAGCNHLIAHCESEDDIEQWLQSIEKTALDINKAQS